MDHFVRQSIHDYLGKLASTSPTPGGGAVAALSLAQAAALLEMVVRISNKTENEALAAVVVRAGTTIEKSTHAARADELAFDKVMRAMRLPKTCPAEQESRKVIIESSCFEAAQVPLALLGNAAELIEDAHGVIDQVGDHLVSDMGIVAHLARAAAESCRYTILINLKSIRDEARRKHCLEGISMQMERIKKAADFVVADTERRLV